MPLLKFIVHQAKRLGKVSIFFNFVVVLWQIKFMLNVKKVYLHMCWCFSFSLNSPCKQFFSKSTYILLGMLHILWCFIESSVMPHIHNILSQKKEEKLWHFFETKLSSFVSTDDTTFLNRISRIDRWQWLTVLFLKSYFLLSKLYLNLKTTTKYSKHGTNVCQILSLGLLNDT